MEMRRILISAAAVMAIGCAAPAMATCDGMPAAPPPLATNSAAMATAQELALVYVPRDMLLAQMSGQMRRGFYETLENNPAAQSRIEQNPELLEQVMSITEDMLRECMPGFIETMQADVANIFAARVPIAHMRTIIGFYRSSVGQRALASVMRNADPLVPRVGPDGRLQPITLAQYRAHVRQPVRNSFDQLSQADRTALNRFGASPAGQSFINSNAPITNALLSRTNAAIAAFQPLLVQRLQRALGGASTAKGARSIP
jgi:hypothetical protein